MLADQSDSPIVADRTEDYTGHYRAGYREASAEALRFLVEVQGYGPGDGLCLQLASHLQRHCSMKAKGETTPKLLWGNDKLAEADESNVFFMSMQVGC